MNGFSSSDIKNTTLIISGLPEDYNALIARSFRDSGYRAVALKTPSYKSASLAKSVCNRAQCNPTYYVVGTLLEYLFMLENKYGYSKEKIKNDYAFLTVGACGPCRFGSYHLEFKNALAKFGFSGFRVFTISQFDGPNQKIGSDPGVKIGSRLFFYVIRSIIVTDIIRLWGRNKKSYEIKQGQTDQIKDEAIHLISERGFSLFNLLTCRKKMNSVRSAEVSKLKKALIVGEFWAVNTEGDGNHNLTELLQAEGVEVDIQPMITWLYYLVWQMECDNNKVTNKKSKLVKLKKFFSKFKPKLLLFSLDVLFGYYSKVLGVKRYNFTSMDLLADHASPYYKTFLRGGEGHLEVGKYICSANDGVYDLVISVKPFGCMPSSMVSDNIMRQVSKLYPDTPFLSLETGLDGSTNFQNRVQMILHLL